MRALVVYESMFGNTRILAEAIAGVLDLSGMNTTVTTAASAPHSTGGYGLVIVGAPTHAHSLPRPASRIEASDWAAETRRALLLEPSAKADGVREWLKDLKIPEPVPSFAAFSTRVDMARILSGDAANAIAKRLRSLKVDRVAMECFLVERVQPPDRWRAGSGGGMGRRASHARRSGGI